MRSGGHRFGRTGPCARPARSTIETGPAAGIRNVLVVSIVNDRCIHAAHCSVIGKVPTLPAATVKSAPAVAKAVVHSTIEAHGRAPVTGVKRVESSRKAPITRCPEETRLRRSHPGAGYPVIGCATITPVARRPKVAVDRTQGLRIDLQRRGRNLNRQEHARGQHPRHRQQDKAGKETGDRT